MSKISPVTGHYVDVDVDGLLYKVFYLENGTGQPLVCQHTAGAHNHQWRGLLEDEEITANYRVIAYDLPRHGKSDPPENTEWWTEEYKLSADHYANFIVALVDALELENPIFMGSSFGGNIALQLALRNPIASPASSLSKVPTTRLASTSTGGSTRTRTQRRCAPAARGISWLPSHRRQIAGRPGSITPRDPKRSRATCTSTRSITICATSSIRSTAIAAPS